MARGLKNQTDIEFVIMYLNETPRPVTRGGTFGKQAHELESLGLAEQHDGFWRLTADGSTVLAAIPAEDKAFFGATKSIEGSLR